MAKAGKHRTAVLNSSSDSWSPFMTNSGDALRKVETTTVTVAVGNGVRKPSLRHSQNRAECIPVRRRGSLLYLGCDSTSLAFYFARDSKLQR